MANILLAHAGRGGNRGSTEAAAEIARAAARSWLAPILETACERLAFVLCTLFDIAMERNHHHHSASKFTIPISASFFFVQYCIWFCYL